MIGSVPLKQMLKIVTSALLLILLLGCSQRAAPNDIAKFAATLQGKSPEQIRGLIEAKYGAPDRDIGSGLVIEQWDIAGGTLTFHPLAGPSFDNGKTVLRLMKTTNLLKDCLFGSYEMYTLPDPNIHGNQFWIGNVSLTDSKYEFTDSNSNLDHRDGQKSNFFINNPAGTVQIDYLQNNTPKTKLEDLADNHLVVTIEFSSTDGTSHKKFDISVDSTPMQLDFESDNIPFEMNRCWPNCWN